MRCIHHLLLVLLLCPIEFSISGFSIGGFSTTGLCQEPAAAKTQPPAHEVLFDGKSLDGWQGNSDLWNVEDGQIVGKTSDAAPIQRNTFLICEKQFEGDFVLELDFYIASGNSGVQYRSRILDRDEYVIGGYQADIDSTMRYMGILYEEQGRGILAERGQVKLLASKQSQQLGGCGDADELSEHIQYATDSRWHRYRIVAIGQTVSHFIDGRLMTLVTDLESEKSMNEGVLALQLHRGPAMEVRFKNITINALNHDKQE